MPGAKGSGGRRPGAGRNPLLQSSEHKIVSLRTPLPCSIRKGDDVCGNPATAAYAWPQESSGAWPTPGLWTLQPVCKACAIKANAVYGYSDKQEK